MLYSRLRAKPYYTVELACYPAIMSFYRRPARKTLIESTV